MTKEEAIKQAKQNIANHPELIETCLQLVYQVGHVDGVKETIEYATNLISPKK